MDSGAQDDRGPRDSGCREKHDPEGSHYRIWKWEPPDTEHESESDAGLKGSEAKNCPDNQDVSGIEARTESKSPLRLAGAIEHGDHLRSCRQISWSSTARLSRIALRALDSNPSTDFGERPMMRLISRTGFSSRYFNISTFR